MTPTVQSGRSARGILGFGARMVLFVTLQIAIVLAFTDWRLDGETSYLAATLDKHRRAIATSPSRIFLVGGSGVPFGFDSPRLERAFQRTVVNLGITAGLGIEFFLNEVGQLARPGDWIVLSPEYSTWYGGCDRTVIRQFLECNPTSLAAFPIPVQVQMLDRYGLGIVGGWLRRSVGLRDPLPDQPDEPMHYRRSRLNRQGDYVGHFGLGASYADLPVDHPWRQPSRIRPVDPTMLDALQHFVDRCEQREVRVFHACPPHPPDVFQADHVVIESNFESLTGIRGLTLLDLPRDAVLPLRKFYDTRYHLTREGMQERTERIIVELRRVLGEPALE